jgi:ubiquitin carboxyl-terminal hydrolase 25/28
MISIQLVLNLQKLFISLIASDKKYIDPSDVVKSICDDFGNHLPIGDQKDVGEFNNYFLSRVEDGL